jgi:hypothetical protein
MPPLAQQRDAARHALSILAANGSISRHGGAFRRARRYRDEL